MRADLLFSLLCGFFLAVGYVAERSPGTVPDWGSQVCYWAAYFWGGYFTLREAADHLLRRRFEIDSLMLIAAIGAASLGAWEEGALLLFLFSIGHALENFAMGRAKHAIEALAKFAPETATVRRNEQTFRIPIEDLVLGDEVIVKPNERLPADGFVVKGSSSVNQAPVTGERSGPTS